MGRPPLSRLAVLVLAGAALSAAPAAGSTFSPSAVLAHHAAAASAPSLAASSPGHVIATWEFVYKPYPGLPSSPGTPSQVMASERIAGAPFEAGVTVSDPARDASKPVSTIDDNGRASIAFAEYEPSGNSFVRVVDRRPGSGWSASATVSDPSRSSDLPAFAGAPSGEQVLAFVVGRSSVDVSTRGPAGPFSTAVAVSPPGAGASVPSVAVNDNGAAVVVWEQASSENTSAVFAARREAAGQPFGAPIRLSPEAGSVDNPRVTIDPSGRATAVFDQIDGLGDTVHAVTLSATGNVGPEQTLSARNGGNMIPHVTSDGAGRVTVVWVRGIPGSGPRPAHSVAEAATAPPDGTFAAPQTLDDGAYAASTVDLAADRVGDVIAAWSHERTTTASGARTATRVAGATSFGPAADVPGTLASNQTDNSFGLGVPSLSNAALAWVATSDELELKASTTGNGATPGAPSATPGPPTPTPAVGGAPARRAFTVKLSVARPRLKIAAVRRARAISVTCSTSAAAGCTVLATVSRATAKALHLRRIGKAWAVAVASGKAKLAGAGSSKVRLRLSKAVRAALARARRSVHVTLVGVAKPAAPGASVAAATAKLTLTRRS